MQCVDLRYSTHLNYTMAASRDAGTAWEAPQDSDGQLERNEVLKNRINELQDKLDEIQYLLDQALQTEEDQETAYESNLRDRRAELEEKENHIVFLESDLQKALDE